MAKFTFKNITADRKAVNGTYDAPINPTLGYSVDNEATLGFAEDFGIAAGDVKIPVYDHGFHGYAVVHPGEAFVADNYIGSKLFFSDYEEGKRAEYLPHKQRRIIYLLRNYRK